ncbi:hypothetical protein CWR43_19695 [Rhizobium sullae]|uniref:Uncharacterized protein n=1 Tax=Rhizobium sullae TaxID=50338 RepID=A0A2N0D676_RHISU|nr:hypothetical protein CWR43_19695 [Rhizobium sullae]
MSDFRNFATGYRLRPVTDVSGSDKGRVVAEDRNGHDSRQHERTEISLGTWQIALKQAIDRYRNKRKENRAADNNGPKMAAKKLTPP